tara:strand:- start:49 stop:477 length:429 start_codon:yes stop_codon:yes gene_type:complete
MYLIFFAPIQVNANPYQIGMQWCQMVRSGMDPANSWRMISEAYASGQPLNMYSQRSDPYSPWYDRSISGRMGDAIGAGITSGIMAVQQLNSWAPDIIRTTDANCPEYGLNLESRAQRRQRIRREKGLPDRPTQKIPSPMDMD